MGNRNEILSRIGHVTRLLHDSLAELGLDRALEQFSSEIPEARDRLDYVAKLTQESADIVLTATERASPLQDEQLSHAQDIEQQLIAFSADPELSESARLIAAQTLAFVRSVQATSLETKDLILSIMMAQDFQDLTGQMIQRMASLTQTLEKQLAQILLDFTSHRNDSTTNSNTENGLLNGPQIIREGKLDRITTQAQVDELLASLGY